MQHNPTTANAPTPTPIDPKTFPDQPCGWSHKIPTTIPNVRHVLSHYGSCAMTSFASACGTASLA